MQKQIALQNKKIIYTLRKSIRARRMRLAVYCDGTIVVTTPLDLQETIVDRFIREKSRWLFSKLAFFRNFKGNTITKYDKKEYGRYKNNAHEFATERANHFNKSYGYHINHINIKNQKTRWGSCSKKGNLNFNYKIVFLPKRLSDYIIVHEICHLGQFNHSRKFWNLVARVIPDYSMVRGELREIGVNFQ